MQLLRRAVPVAGLLAVGACVMNLGPGEASRSSAQLVTWPTLRAPDGASRRCAAAELPRRLPAAVALVDATALGAESAARVGGSTVFSLLFGAEGEVERVRVIQSDLPAAAQEALTAAVGRRLRTQAKSDERWGVQLRVATGARVAVDVGRQEYCPYAVNQRSSLPGPNSAMKDVEQVGMTMGEWATGATRAGSYTIDTLGNVVNAKFQTPEATAYIQGLRYYPALIDRIPVAVVFDPGRRMRSGSPLSLR